jgi:hypothetical protein
MFPAFSLGNTPYRLQRNAVGLGYSRQRLSRFASRSDRRNVGLRYPGVLLLASPFSALWMLARTIGIAARQTLWMSSGAVGVTGQQPTFSGGVSDVVSLRAKPKMRGVTARRIIADVEHANAIRTQPLNVSQPGACGQLIGYPMCKALSSIPIHAAMTRTIAARSDKWPAGVWSANRYAAPEAFRCGVHSPIFGGSI